MAYAASTAGRDSKRSSDGEVVAYRMGLSATIYKGDIVVLETATGLVRAAPIDTTTTTGDMFAGVAQETKTSAAAGTTYINVYVTGIFEFDHAAAGLVVTDLGKVAYHDSAAAGSGTPHHVEFAGASAHDMAVGKLQPPLAADAVKVRIRISGYAGCISVAAAG
jgi:hypothetical protein